MRLLFGVGGGVGIRVCNARQYTKHDDEGALKVLSVQLVCRCGARKIKSREVNGVHS